MLREESQAVFQTTHWTLIEAARSGDEESRSRALSQLAEQYWPAVYAAARRMGMSRDEASETVQGYFSDVVVGRELFRRASEGIGRMRSLIVQSLRNYVRDRARRARSRGSAVNMSLSAIEREEHLLREWGGMAVEDAFSRRWALAMVEEAVAECECYFRGRGKAGHWCAFEARVLRPALAHTTPPALAGLAPELGFRTATDAAAAVQVVKKRLVSRLMEMMEESEGSEDLTSLLERLRSG